MAKPKGINQKSKYRAHSIRMAKYVDRVQSVYDALNEEIASSVVKTSYDGTKPFRFSDYPVTKKKFDEVQAAFVKDLRAVIERGTSEEWKESNLVQDLLADKVLKFYGAKVRGQKHRVYYQTNSDALKAFQKRKDKGLGLSERLWNQSKDYKEEMEYAISSAVEKGTSAVKLSKRLSKYLTDYPTLKKDYKEKFGRAVNCHDCEYRSMRLARSEINMAYRSAEQERWKQFDFVLGYEVKLTQNGKHKPDICDDLAGKYPKDFVFLGWHPNCMCYVIPILKTEDQFWNDEDASEIVEPPRNFTDWLENNAERIDKAAENETLPYWYTDNMKYVKTQKSSAKFDILALPDNLSVEYRKKISDIIELLEKEISEAPSYDQTKYRKSILRFRDIGETLVSKEGEESIIRRYGSVDTFLNEMKTEALKKEDISYYVNYPRGLSDYTRKIEGVRIPVIPEKSLLPTNMEKISEFLDSLESLDAFYEHTGYKSYDEFFEAIGGIDKIEKKLKSLADESRVYMCMDAGTLESKILKGEGKIKNSLETGKGTFSTIGEERAEKERIMFGLPENASYDVMPKYGFLAGKETMDYEDIVSFGYGDTFIRFKDQSIRNRTTITCGDSYDGNRMLQSGKGYSLSTPAASLEQPDANFSLGILSHSYSDTQKALEKLVSAKKMSDIKTSTYIEAQVYGTLRIEDVDAVFVQSKKQMASLTKLLKKQGLDIEVLPCEYDTRLKYLADGFTNYEGKASKYAHSLTDDDIDLLGDFYIDGLTKRFADPRNLWWKKISMPDDFMRTMKEIADGNASSSVKRKWLKSYYAEIRKKKDGAFPKVWWEEYSPKYGGWTSDVLNEKLLKGL